MNKKDVILAVLATFCLSSLMFTVLSTRSGLPYDPWADTNEDGKIDMKDIADVAAQYGTSGDPTKNVNVTNWPQQLAQESYKILTVEDLNISWRPGSSGGACSVNCGGYSRLYLSVYIKNSSFNTPGQNDTFLLSTIYWAAATGGDLLGARHFATYEEPDATGGPSPYSFFVRYPTYPGPAYDADGHFVDTAEIILRSPVINLVFNPYHTVSQTYSGWITFDVRCYLRNE